MLDRMKAHPTTTTTTQLLLLLLMLEEGLSHVAASVISNNFIRIVVLIFYIRLQVAVAVGTLCRLFHSSPSFTLLHYNIVLFSSYYDTNTYIYEECYCCCFKFSFDLNSEPIEVLCAVFKPCRYKSTYFNSYIRVFFVHNVFSCKYIFYFYF